MTGSDQGIYPPMSTMLAEHGVDLHEGYGPEPLTPSPDCVIVGNALRRGIPAVEAVLDRGLDYRSGPQWLAEELLRDKWVLAVSGTHGKTTTASILAWILEYAGMQPGFLIGGVPSNFGRSARLGGSDFFVIEADEYDCAFFDKRSKFVHFRPRTLVINNLEFDHADIFPDLAAIQRQFHHLVRTVPGSGQIIANGDESNIDAALAQGAWTPVQRFGTGVDNDWRITELSDDGCAFTILGEGREQGRVEWSQAGMHNAHNALAALLAARHVGVPVAVGIEALREFRGVKRRLELRGEAAGVKVFDDFAHHPTAISATVTALRAREPSGRILAVLEPRSNTMRLGVHKDTLSHALVGADRSFLFQAPGVDWQIADSVSDLKGSAIVSADLEELIGAIAKTARPGDSVLVMSNGAFGGIHERLLEQLAQSTPAEVSS
ncbi:UDP-N-acetylmuramate:L-alanyl-gamma-D-glutamyl-meso-diaminopimelate ligase [Alkalilimnicola ehrlichii]|uniref:UDP-N-acetylmuramate:L-alanyl-gamma-D-glutamyl- meso-diaminopimelate ligase n=1 Tax=Alkalilimnicola ehrlichii TaxID=351052 RepID=UPI0026C82255